jgi:hypothetical protein
MAPGRLGRQLRPRRDGWIRFPRESPALREYHSDFWALQVEGGYTLLADVDDVHHEIGAGVGASYVQRKR